MLATKPVRLQIGELLAADPTTLAPVANANKVVLIKSAFTPNELLTPADLTPADFDGSTAKLAAVGTQQAGLDPATGDQVITIVEPVGSWRWETTGTTNLPQTIYGYGLYDNTLATLLGIALLPAPLTLQIVGQQINLGTVAMTVVAQPLN
jgi:hypothetical protein